MIIWQINAIQYRLKSQSKFRVHARTTCTRDAYKNILYARVLRLPIFLTHPFWGSHNRLLFDMFNYWHGLLVFATVMIFRKCLYICFGLISIYCSEILKQFVTIQSNTLPLVYRKWTWCRMSSRIVSQVNFWLVVFVDLNKEYIVCKYHRIWKTLKMFNEKENIE